MNILVTGGAGYIGSHAVKQLLENTTHNVFVLDNLSTGFQSTIDTLRSIKEFTFVLLDLKEFDKVNQFLENNPIDCIMHFAASIVVPESVDNPLKYYMNNTVNTSNLIQCAVNNSVEKFIFSSTAAVYGEPETIFAEGIDESFSTNPINPYGMSKLMSENVLRDTTVAHKNFKYAIFRYFNVVGSDMNYEGNNLSPRIGECHEPETHLIPLIAKAALNKRESINVYGDDYDTNDGTCIRDYIHVEDLVSAHLEAITFLEANDSNTFNLGYGKGFSVKEVIDVMKFVSNKDFNVVVTERRAGDPACLISNNKKITQEYKYSFNWNIKYNDLELICQSAYTWEKNL